MQPAGPIVTKSKLWKEEKKHSMTVTEITPFDGYLPVELLVWFLLQVALDKKLVRTGVCVYALRLLVST